jgi:hypothetical protein
MNQWKEYCYKITSSKFLMGEVNDFKASLDWSLKFETIHRIKEGAYNQGTRATGKDLVKNSSGSAVLDFDEIIEHESKEAIDIRKKIIKKIGNDLYKSWFTESRIIMKEGRGIIFVSNRFRSDRIQTQFSNVLETFFLDVNISNDCASLKEEETQNKEDISCSNVEKNDLPNTNIEKHIPVENQNVLNVIPKISKDHIGTYNKNTKNMIIKNVIQSIDTGRISSFFTNKNKNSKAFDVNLAFQ